MRGQGLAGRDAEPQAVGARALADVLVREQRGVERGHPVEDGDAVALERLEHAFRRRPVRPERGGGADREREGQGVAEPIGKEQLRGGMHDVVLGNAENALAEQFRGRHQVGMDVLDALGVAGRARGVEPEGDFDSVSAMMAFVSAFMDQVLEGMCAAVFCHRQCDGWPRGSLSSTGAIISASAASTISARARQSAKM